MSEVTERTVVIPDMEAETTTVQDITQTIYNTSSLAELSTNMKRLRRTVSSIGVIVELTSAAIAIVGGYAILDGITSNNPNEVINGFTEIIGAGFGFYTGANAWLQKQRCDRRIATIQHVARRLSRQGGIHTP